MSHIQELRDVIRQMHGADARHVESVPLHETFAGRTVWQGVVEVFDLVGHPKTHRVYAWSHETDDPDEPERHVTVLHLPPVESAITAVRAALMEEYKRLANPSEA